MLARCASARLIQVMLPSGTPCYKANPVAVRAKYLLVLLALVAFLTTLRVLEPALARQRKNRVLLCPRLLAALAPFMHNGFLLSSRGKQ